MKHTPYGYMIVDGKAVVDEPKATQVNMLFTKFLEGESLAKASKSCLLSFTHGQIARMLEENVYCGDEFYPPIITKEVFEQVQEERAKRAKTLGRLNKAKVNQTTEPATDFKWKPVVQKQDNPLKQAEYLYSLIETEV